jgi:hypothetical protein
VHLLAGAAGLGRGTPDGAGRGNRNGQATLFWPAGAAKGSRAGPALTWSDGQRSAIRQTTVSV